ncbi:MAG TPA: TetR/AcrR family transcriptional regulator [Mycobacteriales bacterium]|nr:TetR/AcrR family transcriptional regulator [Mycobacteriales bacterium]
MPDAQASPTTGGRTRAGNGMSRARAGILSGAATCVARYGTRKTTMGDIAREGGVAKATLYNHFRTKDDVLAALLAHEVDALARAVETAGGQPGTAEAVTAALSAAATFVAEHPVLRHLAVAEPSLVASLITPSDNALWQRARGVARDRLSLAQAAGSLHPRHETESLVDAGLRWVLSHALWPASSDDVQAAAYRLVNGLVAEPRPRLAARPAEEAESVQWARAEGLQVG